MSERISIERSSGNVFEDLGFDNPEEVLEKVDLAFEIGKAIAGHGWTSKEAAAHLGVDLPKVSKLKRGIVEGFSIERLFKILNLAGMDVAVTVRPAAIGHGRTTIGESWAPVAASGDATAAQGIDG